MVTRCASCAEPIEEEAETCPDCGVSLFNNVVTGLEALGHEEGDGDA
jgi:RNA polymerase subunit RPABC4/transcription elongation factor Spt4